ncbi:MAG: prepilin-type N-terminal cleavage/methylation domain-containing protein [Thermodesulfobacteriota bacterium]|nr:prepilin-type N-terminal cleavage/methylation domain-containing protein [Thermodesulfobacteriota bacterium]
MVKGRIRILRTGKLNRRGFTLVELTVVIFLVGLMLLIAIPRVRDTVLTNELKSTVNYLAQTALELRSTSVREQIDYLLYLDINDRLIWFHTSDMTPEAKSESKKRAYHLPGNVKIADGYRFGREKQIDGEIIIRFFREGYVQPTVVHLVDGSDFFTLVFEPFLNDIKVHESYIEIEYSP